MNKVMKYQLEILEDQLSFKEIMQVLFQLQRDVRNIKNRTIQMCWDFDTKSMQHKQETGEYLDCFEMFGYKMFTGYVYSQLRDTYSYMFSANFSSAIKEASDKFKADKKDILKGEKSIPSYTKNQPIHLNNRSIKLICDDGVHWNAELSLFSKAYSKELGLPSTKLRFKVSVKDKSQRAILGRCYTEEYKLSASQLIYNEKKKKWFLYLSYGFENVVDDTLNEQNVMGVNLGLIYPVYMAFNNNRNQYYIEGGEIEAFRAQVEKRTQQRQRQGKYCGDGRIGHGTQTRIKPIYNAKQKVSNFRDTINHRYSRYIVDMALKHNCGIIQLENLKDISTDQLFLKNWPYYDLQQKIEYKAKEKGIKVIYIEPQYTTLRCSKCGHIDDENHDSNDLTLFHCTKCGYKTNAYFNAAKNISMLGIDKDIEIALKEQAKQKKEAKTA